MDRKGEGNIKVFCRFRPFNRKEMDANPARLHRISKGTQLIIRDPKSEEISFMYDSVFDMESTQEQIFQTVGSPVLDNILQGFHGTIMAYGQTSSGKTHTMQGYDLNEKENRGIMPRIIERLFAAIDKSPESIQFILKISIFQLYMEKIRDLLDVSKNNLKIRESKQLGCFIQDLTEKFVSDKQELFKIITHGQKNRITCATNMNEHSSRSHLIFQLSVSQFNNLENTTKTSKLFLIDLAGSEKISKTGAEGKVLEQAKKINLSLTNLGKVIKALSERGKKEHVPYRDSKLTRILKDSLGGNSKTTLVVTCSPHQMHLPETISTLRFGENAQKVKNKPKINTKRTVEELQKIVEKMEAQSKEYTTRISMLEEYITVSLKADLPKSKIVAPLVSNEQIKAKLGQKEEEGSEVEQEEATQTVVQMISEETEQRINALEEALKSSKLQLNVEMDKYYQLKKEYNELHQNLTQILTENMQLQDQLQEKKKKFSFGEKSLQDNAYLIKLIVGELMNAVGKENQAKAMSAVSESFWYKRIMIDSVPCSDYWHQQKEIMNRQLQQLMNESYALQDKTKKSEEGRRQKDNQKIIELQKKFDLLLQEYNSMMDLQTNWKAECQLYERKLKHKQEQIHVLEKTLEELKDQMNQMDLYEDFIDDTMSVKSNKIIKPLKGGLQFH